MGKYDRIHQSYISSLFRKEDTHQKSLGHKPLKNIKNENFTNSAPKYTWISITTTLCHVILPISNVCIKDKPKEPHVNISKSRN